ncbi:MAG: hypothetical protein GY861_23055 [bacterium]|nr:hypothetical protein [bacterium]
MMDLYTFLVENVFGGFWMASIAMALIFLLILAMGGVSGFSIGMYLLIFFFVMGLGNGTPILTVPIAIFIISWSVLQMRRFYEEV